jgi:catalase
VTVTPEQAVGAANEVFGRHPGYRALHAKGTLCKGSFTAAPAGAALTRAAHMRGEPVPATIRFSNGSGNPQAPDTAPDVRGLAVKLYLPDGSRTDIVGQTAPRFPVRTPEVFIELLHASHPGPAMPFKFARFLARNPAAVRSLPANVAALRPPVSYAAVPYYALHAFCWVDGDGGARYVRYTWVPQAPARSLSPLAAKRLGRDYLQQELRERLARGPARFTLELQIGADGDPVEDPTAVWPEDRPRLFAGTLEVTGLETERETGGDVLIFDPTRVTDGIELSADPILQFRSAAYSASVARRMPSE